MKREERPRVAVTPTVVLWGIAFPLLFAPPVGAEPDPIQVRWSVELYADNPDYIAVTVDTTQLAPNVYLEGVTFDARFFDAAGKPIGKTLRESFTAEDTGGLEAGGVHVKYFEHHHAGAYSVKGGYLYWGRPGIVGGKADTFRPRTASTKSPISSQQAILHGSLPPSGRTRKGAIRGDLLTVIADTLTGEWQYRMTSDVSHGTYQGKLTLKKDGSLVSGVLETHDGSDGAVTGNLSGDTLELTRAATEDTVQHYRLNADGPRYSGKFWNTGRWPDSGTFEIWR